MCYIDCAYLADNITYNGPMAAVHRLLSKLMYSDLHLLAK